jgi:hypothetical protein
MRLLHRQCSAGGTPTVTPRRDFQWHELSRLYRRRGGVKAISLHSDAVLVHNSSRLALTWRTRAAWPPDEDLNQRALDLASRCIIKELSLIIIRLVPARGPSAGRPARASDIGCSPDNTARPKNSRGSKNPNLFQQTHHHRAPFGIHYGFLVSERHYCSIVLFHITMKSFRKEESAIAFVLPPGTAPTQKNKRTV